MSTNIRNRHLIYGLILAAALPLIVGQGLHLIIGCSHSNCSLHCQQERRFEHRCTCPHHDAENNSQEESTGHHDEDCSFCDFFALSKTPVAAFVWLPDICPVEQENLVHSVFVVSIFRGFAFGRAPPLG